jgi:hypothetical protein
MEIALAKRWKKRDRIFLPLPYPSMKSATVGNIKISLLRLI